MIWGQIKMCEKICPYYPIFHISYCEIELKVSLAYSYGTGNAAKAPDLRAVCGAELRSRRSEAALLTCGRNYGEQGSSIDEPLFLAAAVYDVKEKRITLAGNRVHARGAGFPFAAWLVGHKMHHFSHLLASSPNLMWKSHTLFLGFSEELELG